MSKLACWLNVLLLLQKPWSFIAFYLCELESAGKVWIWLGILFRCSSFAWSGMLERSCLVGFQFVYFWTARYIKPWVFEIKTCFWIYSWPSSERFVWKVLSLCCPCCHLYDHSIAWDIYVHTLCTDVLYSAVPYKTSWKYKYSPVWPPFSWPFSHCSRAPYYLHFTS